MTEPQFKRNIAYKFRIGDILSGKPMINNERFSFLDLENKKVIRVNVVGSIVDKYENEGEKKFSLESIISAWLSSTIWFPAGGITFPSHLPWGWISMPTSRRYQSGDMADCDIIWGCSNLKSK